jgi:hypothetical protein
MSSPSASATSTANPQAWLVAFVFVEVLKQVQGVDEGFDVSMGAFASQQLRWRL